MAVAPAPPHIGTLRERSLHAALKQWYREAGDELEARRDGYVIDLVRGPLLVEVQTGSFTPLRAKLRALLPRHQVRVVHPVAVERMLVRATAGGEVVARRRSPLRGSVLSLFDRLVAFPELMCEPGLSLEVVLVREEELRLEAPRTRRRRRPYRIVDRQLVEVLDRHLFRTPGDLAALLPPHLPDPFGTAELAAAMGIPRPLAQRVTYCLRRMDALEAAGRGAAGVCYRLRSPSSTISAMSSTTVPTTTKATTAVPTAAGSSATSPCEKATIHES